MPDCVLGLDASKRKLGIGVIAIERLIDDSLKWSPVRAYSRVLDGAPETAVAVVADIASYLAAHDLEPQFAYIETPQSKSGQVLHEAGVGIGHLEVALRLTWAGIVIDRLQPNTWRSRAGVPSVAPKKVRGSDARRKWHKANAVYYAREHGFVLPALGGRGDVLKVDDDAAEGAMMAVAIVNDILAGRATYDPVSDAA